MPHKNHSFQAISVELPGIPTDYDSNGSISGLCAGCFDYLILVKTVCYPKYCVIRAKHSTSEALNVEKSWLMGAVIDNESGKPYFSYVHYKVQQDFILIAPSIHLDLSRQIIVFGVNFHRGISISRNETENKTGADITPSKHKY